MAAVQKEEAVIIETEFMGMVRSMIDNRIALHKESRIYGSDKTISIKGEIGRGASCIVYDAVYIDRIGVEHIIRVRECYPAYLPLRRTEEGAIAAAAEDEEKYKEAKYAFEQAYKKNVSFRGTLGIVNSTVNSTDIFKNNNTVYTVMAMDEGIDYRKYKDPTLKELLEHIKTLSELIMKYHECGYLHLDIKPENIFILPETAEHILLYDFDTVMTQEELRAEGRYKIPFTEGFSAPEQIQGRVNKIDRCTDIYSIGAVLFFKLFNRKAELEDIKINAEYCFEDMCYPNEKYQPRLYRALRDFFKKTISIAAITRWQEMPPVIDMLKQLIKFSDTEGIYLLDSFSYNSANFVGRQKEMEDIKNILDDNQLVFLSGIGGIGKTELAKQYANKYRNQYDAVIFAVFEKSIQSLVCDEIGINKISRDEEESEDDYFKRKIEIMKQTVTPNDLIIIDNFDVESDENLEELFCCPCKFIVTTRMDYRDYNYRQITVDRIDDTSDILSLFCAYNDLSYSAEENEAVEKLIEYVEYHTMTVELIAKYLRNSDETPIELYKKFLEREGVANTQDVSVKQRKDCRLKSESVNEHLRILFDVSGFDSYEKEIIGSLSLFAGVRIRKSKFNEICAVENIENKLDGLIRKGWIEYNEHSEKISLHQVIQDLIYHDLEPNAGNCSGIVNGMCEYISSEVANCSDRRIRKKLLDVFMDRLSGDSIPYARLCMIYGEEAKRDEAEKICLACGGTEAFDLLQRIYRKKIIAAGKCEDMFDSESDVDEYIVRRLVLVGEMFDKAVSYCRKSSEEPDYLVKEYIEAGCETDRVISDNIWGNTSTEEPVPEMDEVFRKIIRIFDEAAELLPKTSYAADEKEKWYVKIRDFYTDEDISALYRGKNYLDMEKAYRYQRIIDRLREESQGKTADVVIRDGTETTYAWRNDVRCIELAGKYEDGGKYEKAIEYYRKAYEEDDEPYEIMMQNIAHVYLKWRKPAKAIGYLVKLLFQYLLEDAPSEKKVTDHKCDAEEQIEFWSNAAGQYQYNGNRMMQIDCLNKALEIAGPILYEDECSLFAWDYRFMMQSLIYAYIDTEAYEEADDAIRELHDRTVEYIMRGDDPDMPWNRLWFVKEIADYYVRISRNMDATAEYLRAMYAGLAEQLDFDLMMEKNVTRDFIEQLCEVVGKLLERELEPNLEDDLIDIKDKLITCRDKCLNGCEVYDRMIAKLTGLQQKEIEFKRE